jgi:ubiquinone/menaquinone biosynthesis C-methylase UbiE
MKEFDKFWLDEYNKRALQDISDYEKIFQDKKWTFKQYKAVKRILKQIKCNNQNVLDAGCGTGLFSYLLFDMGNNVVGIDYSDELINIANKNKGKKDIKFQQANLYNIPCGNDYFDLILNLGVLPNVEDHTKVIFEITRVVKKNGKIVFLTLRQPSKLETPFIFFYLIFSKKLSFEKAKRIIKTMMTSNYMNSSYSDFIAKAKRYKIREIMQEFEKNNMNILKIKYIGLFGTRFLSKSFIILSEKKR